MEDDIGETAFQVKKRRNKFMIVRIIFLIIFLFIILNPSVFFFSFLIINLLIAIEYFLIIKEHKLICSDFSFRDTIFNRLIYLWLIILVSLLLMLRGVITPTNEWFYFSILDLSHFIIGLMISIWLIFFLNKIKNEIYNSYLDDIYGKRIYLRMIEIVFLMIWLFFSFFIFLPYFF